VAHDGEHARVLRDAQLGCAPQHEGYRAAGLDSVGVLDGVDRLFEQSVDDRACVPITGLTAAVHPESRDDVLHQLDEQAPQRVQPELGERWRADLVCACSCGCHGRDYIAGPRPGRICGAVSYEIRSEGFDFVGEDFRLSYELGAPLSHT